MGPVTCGCSAFSSSSTGGGGGSGTIRLGSGESCPAAVQREFQEELSASVKIGELKFVSESIYPGRKKAEKLRHELVLYYEGELQGDLPEEAGRIISPEPQKNFRWLPLSELPESNLVPSSFKQFLMQQSSALYAFDDSTR